MFYPLELLIHLWRQLVVAMLYSGMWECLAEPSAAGNNAVDHLKYYDHLTINNKQNRQISE